MFRFYRTKFQESMSIEWTCETGTTAVSTAMALDGEIAADIETCVMLEVGSHRIVGRKQMLTELALETLNGTVVDTQFSHSLIELLEMTKSTFR